MKDDIKKKLMETEKNKRCTLCYNKVKDTVLLEQTVNYDKYHKSCLKKKFQKCYNCFKYDGYDCKCVFCDTCGELENKCICTMICKDCKFATIPISTWKTRCNLCYLNNTKPCPICNNNRVELWHKNCRTCWRKMNSKNKMT